MKINNNFYLDFDVIIKTRNELRTTMLTFASNIKQLNDFKVTNGKLSKLK